MAAVEPWLAASDARPPGQRPVSPPQLPALATVPIVGRDRGQLASAVDGRYGALDPAALDAAIGWLTSQIDLSGVRYVVGIPEGGTIPAYAFARATGLKVILATIWQPDLPGVISFAEAHDPPPVTGKHIFGLAPGDRVVIVEDEVSSGRTVVNCIRALRSAGIQCNQVATIYAADDRSMRARLTAERINLSAASAFDAEIARRLYR